MKIERTFKNSNESIRKENLIEILRHFKYASKDRNIKNSNK